MSSSFHAALTDIKNNSYYFILSKHNLTWPLYSLIFLKDPFLLSIAPSIDWGGLSRAYELLFTSTLI